MPLCLSRSKKTRSPGLSWLLGTGAPCWNCSATLRGSAIPTRAKAYRTSPEQSKPDGLEPPHTYGTPTYRFATRAASTPRAAPALTSRGAGAPSARAGAGSFTAIARDFVGPEQASTSSARPGIATRHPTIWTWVLGTASPLMGRMPRLHRRAIDLIMATAPQPNHPAGAPPSAAAASDPEA